MTRTIFDNATVLDVVGGRSLPRHRVVITDGIIERVEPVGEPLASNVGQVINARGMTVMPGLCDAHVHVTAWTANLAIIPRTSPSYTAARAADILSAMLDRGFTTVRDAGGADYGLAQAIEEGYLRGPRVLFCGHALSPSGGHGDLRGRGEHGIEELGSAGALGLVVDGVDALRRACRDEIRRGAHHLKLMLNGGVASPTDRLTNLQFSADEVQAAVEEAAMAGLYVMAHTYTATAVNRAIRLGVRSLEHCNLIDDSSIDLFLTHHAFMVPTLATYQALAAEGVAAGLPLNLLDKLALVLDGGLRSLALAYEAGVPLVYGTDLLGSMHRHQLAEFAIRAAVQPPIDVIRAATCAAADLFGETGHTGLVAPGARADLLVVDGDPLADLGCLQDPDRRLRLIMKGGQVYKDTL